MSATGKSHADVLRPLFPNIQKDAVITSPETSTYNCIAYAAGDHNRWWWPDALLMHYWPRGVIRLPTLPAFQAAFESIGFSLCATGDYDDVYEKIAIFHLNNSPTHAAKLIAKDVWSSKLGQSYDISHTQACLDDTKPGSYGTIAFFMSRKRAGTDVC